jgi:dihydrofolate reductase
MKGILAVDGKGGIGKNGTLPWHHSQDLRRFRTLTESATMVMGSNTFFSLPINKRPLPGKHRRSIVLTFDPEAVKFDAYRRTENLQIMDLHTFRSAYSAEDRASMFFIGGADLYRVLFPEIHELHLTQLNGDYQCDTFVRVDWTSPKSPWDVAHHETHEDHTYTILTKKTPT